MKIAKEYELAGAAAVSCLTEPYYFKGSDDYLREIAETISIPILRKDFTVNSYMIYQAKLLGAAAILLICAILDDEQLVEYLKIADSLGLDALVEAIERLSPWAVDLSSSLEIGGLKDRDKIIEAVNIVRSFEQLK